MKQSVTVGFALALAAASPCGAGPGGGCRLTPVAGAMSAPGGAAVVAVAEGPRVRLARLGGTSGACQSARTGTASAILMTFGCEGLSA
ncbi:MAG: hypothetical protein KDK28_18565 [Maritimibacter sp.]|nr:hypothetical protein [Maritimibacter sp.]